VHNYEEGNLDFLRSTVSSKNYFMLDYVNNKILSYGPVDLIFIDNLSQFWLIVRVTKASNSSVWRMIEHYVFLESLSVHTLDHLLQHVLNSTSHVLDTTAELANNS